MRAMCRVLLMSAVCLVASFNAVSAVTTTDFDQTDPSNALSDGALLTQSRTAAVKYNNSPRFLRASVTAELSTDSEERGISSVIAKLEAKLKATLKKMGITPALLTKIKRRIRYYFWNQMWNIRYTIWLKKKVTPEQMYEKLSVRYTSGPYHKNYRIYVKYLRMYEYYYGPAYNPLIIYGPKNKILILDTVKLPIKIAICAFPPSGRGSAMRGDLQRSKTAAHTHSEPLESSPRLATHLATQWLASMDEMRDEDAMDKSPIPKTQQVTLKPRQPNCNAPNLATKPVCKKRELQKYQSENTHLEQEVQNKKPKRKYRKSTINVRKEEKAHLLEELAELHTKIEELKARAFASCVGVEARTPSELQSVNRVLRRAIQAQQLECTKIHALMSEYSLFNIRAGSPIHRPIHLHKDQHSRKDTLLGMKNKVLEDGAKFLRDRLPCVDPCKPMREDHGYEASNGDFYASYICTMQFENSVKEVYDILLGYFSNIEISVSEKLGNITVREDDDSMAPGITTNRMVSTTIGGLRMESNTVYFSRYDEGDEEVGHQNGYGIFVADYVDEDELNPYHPHERIRRDFSTVLELTSYPIKHGVRTRSENTKEGHVVVLTRWVHSKTYHPEYEIPQTGWLEMRDNTERWIQTLHHTMMERLSPVVCCRR